MTIVVNGTVVRCEAIADSGNSTALAIPKPIADQIGLKEEDAFSEYEEVRLADGNFVACLLYELKIKFAAEEMEATVYVPDTFKKLKPETSEEDIVESKNPRALLGRKIMNSYQVIFDGTTTPRTVSFLQ